MLAHRCRRRTWTWYGEGLLRFSETDREIFENVRYEPSDFIYAGDHVVVRVRQGGRGKASGAAVEERGCGSTRPNVRPSKP